MTEKQLKEIQDRYETNETGVDAYAILGAHAKKDIPNLLFYIRVLEDNLNMAEDDKAVLVEALEKMLKAYEMILPGVEKIAV